MTDTNVRGEAIVYNIGLTRDEFDELLECLDFVLENDDLEPDEREFTSGLRKKLRSKRKQLMRRERQSG